MPRLTGVLYELTQANGENHTSGALATCRGANDDGAVVRGFHLLNGFELSCFRSLSCELFFPACLDLMRRNSLPKRGFMANEASRMEYRFDVARRKAVY